jgi:hypothetical protein
VAFPYLPASCVPTVYRWAPVPSGRGRLWRSGPPRPGTDRRPSMAGWEVTRRQPSASTSRAPTIPMRDSVRSRSSPWLRPHDQIDHGLCRRDASTTGRRMGRRCLGRSGSTDPAEIRHSPFEAGLESHEALLSSGRRAGDLSAAASVPAPVGRARTMTSWARRSLKPAAKQIAAT